MVLRGLLSMRRLGLAACACLIAVAAAPQPAADPLVGRWELNVARSHYGGGAEPRIRESFVCAAAGAAVHCTIRSVRADGRAVSGELTARYGGPPGPVRGIPELDHVRLTRVSASIADATFTFQGRPVFAYRAVKSTDGRSLTVIAVDPSSRTVLNSVVVYDRQ